MHSVFGNAACRLKSAGSAFPQLLARGCECPRLVSVRAVRATGRVVRGGRLGRPSVTLAAATTDSPAALNGLPPEIIGARGKVTRSALNKLRLPELREICKAVGLSSEGKKMQLVESIYELYVAEPSGSGSDGSTAAAAASARVSTGAPAEPCPPPAQREPSAQTQQTRGASRGPADSNRQDAADEGGAPGLPASTGLSVTWLGTSSGAPTQQRNVSCIAVDLDSEGVLLVDCGEGTKRQLVRSHLNPAAIHHLCVTHMHGDHCFGIPGLLSFISSHKATQPEKDRRPLYIYGPQGVFDWVQTALQSIPTRLSMRVLVTEFHKARDRGHPPQPMDDSGSLWLAKAGPSEESVKYAAALRRKRAGNNAEAQRQKGGVTTGLSWAFPVGQQFRVSVAQLLHRGPCVGYCIQEAKTPVAVNSDFLKSHGITGDPEDVKAMIPGRKALILGDTCDSTSIAHLAMDADMISHEATFSDGMEKKALIAGHSTSRMAGEFARSINAQRLFLTHFSARFQTIRADSTTKFAPEGVLGEDMTSSDIDAIVAQAQDGFGSPAVVAVEDFLTYRVPRRPVHIMKQLRA